MRWNDKKSYEVVVRKKFAIFPINIDGEARWLETVTVRGYWWKGYDFWFWKSLEFVD